MEVPTNSTAIFQSLNGSVEDAVFDIPLFATYLKMLILLVVMPTIIIPALLLIHVIWKNEQLHTKYYLFVANLLITDIATTMRLPFEMFTMVFYLFDVDVNKNYHNVFYTILTIPRVAALYAFILLAIDRVIGVGFPYHHRNIMTTKVANTLIGVMWLGAASISLLIKATTSLVFVEPFGFYLVSPNPVTGVIVAFPMLGSVALTVATNVYLYYITVQSNNRLQQNLKLSERNEQKINRLRRLLHALQKQTKPTLSVLILGGIDCVVNLLRSVLYGLANTYFPSDVVKAYIMQFSHLLGCCQTLSHYFVYGLYTRDIYRQLKKYKFYQRAQQMLHLKVNKVAPANS